MASQSECCGYIGHGIAATQPIGERIAIPRRKLRQSINPVAGEERVNFSPSGK